MLRTIRRRQRHAALEFTLQMLALVLLGAVTVLIASLDMVLLTVVATVVALILGAALVMSMGEQYLPRHPSTIERFRHALYRLL